MLNNFSMNSPIALNSLDDAKLLINLKMVYPYEDDGRLEKRESKGR